MYIPLKITTDYSLLKSIIKIDDLIIFLLENKISSCAICDEFLYGTMEFYDKCIKNNIKPIVGLDVIINNSHLYLYAIDYKGYQSLLKINTIKTERILELEDLEKYNKNVLVIIPFNSISIYKQIINIYDEIFIGYQTDREKTEALFMSSKVVYVNDIRSLRKEDSRYLNYLEMIRKDEKIDSYQFQEFLDNYFRLDISSEDQETTKKVSNLLNIVIPKDANHIPKYNFDISDSDEYLENLTKKGLKKRLNGLVINRYLERLYFRYYRYRSFKI